MAKVFVKDCIGFEGAAHEYTSADDGYPKAVIVPWVCAPAEDGGQYWLPNDVKVGFDEDGFQTVSLRFDLQKARDIARRVRERGYIEAEHWVYASPEEVANLEAAGFRL